MLTFRSIDFPICYDPLVRQQAYRLQFVPILPIYRLLDVPV